jgi:tellurite resistance protein TerC
MPVSADAEVMSVPWWVWLATLGALVALLALDTLVGRGKHRVTTWEAAAWVGLSVACSVLFGLGVWWFGDARFATEYFTGYLIEYSLSVDNLFVFMVIMSSFAVPRDCERRVLLVGICLALVLRGGFIAVGAAVIAHFEWVFFLFGGLLLWTAIGMIRKGEEHGGYRESPVVRWVRRLLPVTRDYHGTRLLTKVGTKWWFTPMFVVIIAIGSTDVIFAVDSIPAIFGITRDPFLVFAANAFALMGLRQLYFLLGGLMGKLAFLSFGLAAILIFLGIKLILHSLRYYRLVPDWAEINNWTSLLVIVAVLVVTALASWVKYHRGVPRHTNEHT